MKLILFSLVGSGLILAGCASTPPPTANGLTFKEAKKSVQLYDHRSPFDGTKEVSLTSINLRFMTAERQNKDVRKIGNTTTWTLLDGIDPAVFQEIADEYYKRLSKKLQDRGYAISDKYKNSKHYASLVDDHKNTKRLTFDKSWGVAETVTANQAPYIEYGAMAFGSHARLGNEQEHPVGQMFITIRFADILQEISSSTSLGDKITHMKASVSPRVSVAPPTMHGISRAFAAGKGDGTYALFQGKSWGATNVSLNKALHSNLEYSTAIESANGLPEQFKRFQNDTFGDLVSIFSGGLISNDRAKGEFAFNITADPEKYKAAVLDALEKWNEHLFLMIDSTR